MIYLRRLQCLLSKLSTLHKHSLSVRRKSQWKLICYSSNRELCASTGINFHRKHFLLVIVFTVGGNSLVCIAVIRERHLQNTTNYFLTSLAFTDCLVACLVMPLAVTVELIGHFPFDALACNVWLTFDVCCCTSSIWHMR